MAQIKKIAWDSIPQGKRVTIGHNRTIYKSQADLLYCSLHDNTVAFFRRDSAGGFDVTFDSCGWLSTTTCRAIGDFCRFVGISAGVSRAKGKFSARYQITRDTWADQGADDTGQRIYFHAPFIDPWSHFVVVTGIFPSIKVLKAKSEYQAKLAADHIAKMFPHLRNDNLRILPESDVSRHAVNASGFLADCAQAYVITGNGSTKPPKGSVAACGKDS